MWSELLFMDIIEEQRAAAKSIIVLKNISVHSYIKDSGDWVTIYYGMLHNTQQDVLMTTKKVWMNTPSLKWLGENMMLIAKKLTQK